MTWRIAVTGGIIDVIMTITAAAGMADASSTTESFGLLFLP